MGVWVYIINRIVKINQLDNRYNRDYLMVNIDTSSVILYWELYQPVYIHRSYH